MKNAKAEKRPRLYLIRLLKIWGTEALALRDAESAAVAYPGDDHHLRFNA